MSAVQVKASTISVTTGLRGGANGHLRLMLTSAEYSNILRTVRIKLVHPGALVVPPGSIKHETTRLRDKFKETVKLHQKVNQNEKTLIK